MKFTPEQIKQIEKAMWEYRDSMNPVDDTLAELTKPEWKPSIGQVYWSGKVLVPHKREGWEKGSSPIRPLTLAEHGPDVLAMQDALKRIASASARAGCRQFAALVLKDHEIK